MGALTVAQAGRSTDTVTYSYDSTEQLTRASHLAGPSAGANETYSYDANGNRTSANHVAYVAPATGDFNRVYNDGTFTYTYDGEGNIKTQTRIATVGADDYYRVNTYDQRNRLVKVTYENNSLAVTKTVEVVYDVFNQRIAETATNYVYGIAGTPVTTKFAWQNGQVALQFDGANHITRRNLWGQQANQLIAFEVVPTTDTPNQSGEVYWAYADYEGSLRELYDSSNALVWRQDYDSFGNPTEIYRASSFTAPVTVGFAGMAWDANLGFYYDLNRWYDPTTGRFRSPDPIDATPNNAYPFVGNSPTNGTDPTGLVQVIEGRDGKPAVYVHSGGQVGSGYSDDAPGPAGAALYNYIETRDDRYLNNKSLESQAHHGGTLCWIWFETYHPDAAREWMKLLFCGKGGGVAMEPMPDPATVGGRAVPLDIAAKGQTASAKSIQHGASESPTGRAEKPARSENPLSGDSEAGTMTAQATTGRIRNQHLAGQRHPRTGVLFDNDGFPVFESAHDATIPKSLRGSTVSDSTQFRNATQQLNEALEQNPALKENFTQAQLDAIAQGAERIPGYTWHHNQDGIRLQLVDGEVHRLTGHSGGRQLTGGRP